MIWQGPAIAIILHILVYFFNFLLLIVLKRSKVLHSKVYIFNMIISEVAMNLTQNFLIEFPYFFPQDPDFYSLWPVKVVEIISQMSYQCKFFIAILMAVNRLWIVMKPIGSEVFSSMWLKVYMAVGWIVLFFRQLIIIVPDDCYFKMDLDQFQVITFCENLEDYEIRLLINSIISKFIHIFLPWTAVLLNLIVFVFLKLRKKKHQMNRKSLENSLFINSFVVSLLLTTNYIYNHFYLMFEPTLSQQSPEIQSAFSFFNFYGCSFFNFVVYFLLDPINRRNVINILTSEKRKIRVRSLRIVF
ncbi:G-protein coupled receptors family 1 profile domain-containing protein [Caenorhabditis elegans]|uniref:G-protein coupled receptors family 1 profile domain-containing protein n=1 Tax=Caenorhabditis elegans TaxID=6239 RepID=O45516_CAEEL|nr:G-protein coupled receptors family 1 profile domain-containing protein [Caenorhabditis elegans]CAB05515.2 G-protein coupled receptors family 1 profile domain-containing protein [Caenorhabditis elegans]|eukprot:NP_507056.2 Serpentine Receptor, class XA [Caenorhabditis elegans]